jgi:hypothetical protein
MTNLIRLEKNDDGVYLNGKEINFNIYFYIEKIHQDRLIINFYEQTDQHCELISKDMTDIICDFELYDLIRIYLDEIIEVIDKVSLKVGLTQIELWRTDKTVRVTLKPIDEANKGKTTKTPAKTTKTPAKTTKTPAKTTKTKTK